MDDANWSKNPGLERMPTPPIEFELPPPGTFFGVVYDLQGARIGDGYVRKNQKVAIRKRVVAYIGKRRGPVASAVPTPVVVSQVQPHLNGQSSGQDDSKVVGADPPNPFPVQDATSQKGQPDAQPGPILPNGASSRAPPSGAGEGSSQPASAAPCSTSSRQRSPRGRAYIGKRSALDSDLYVSMDEIIVRALRQEEEEDWGEPPSDPMAVDVQDGAGGSEAARAKTPPIADVQCAIAIALSALQDMQVAQAAAVTR